MDPVKILPTEVIENILSYLNLVDLMECCLVSQKWNIAANNENLWKEFCLNNGWSDCGSLKKHLNSFSFISTDSEKDTFNSLGDWKKHFVLKNQLQKNWRAAKSVDHVIHPLKNIDGTVVGNISSITSDGHNLLAFGFENGFLSLYNLKNNSESLLLNKSCLLDSSVEYIEIVNQYLVLIQENLLQIYKFDDDDNSLELYRAKIINCSSIIDVDLLFFLEMDLKIRTDLIKETRERFDDNVLYHFSEPDLVVTSFFSHKINIYSPHGDFRDPIDVFNLEEIEIDLKDKFIFNIHCNNGVLYILLSVYNHVFLSHQDEFESKYMLHSFSMKTKERLFSSSLENSQQVSESIACSIETNDRYLVLRFDMHYFYLVDRSDGKVLINDLGVIFLNANSDPSVIGVCLDVSFQMKDPLSGACYFCVTLDGSPISIFSNVLITSCVEYDRNGDGTTEMEFWSLHKTYSKIDSIKFYKNPNVVAIYKDDTKIIFYAERDHVLARSFLV